MAHEQRSHRPELPLNGFPPAPFQRVVGFRVEAAVALIAVACYANTLPNEYCHDDRPIVESSRVVNEPGQWLAIWMTDYWSQARVDSPLRDLLYRPVTVTSYRVVRTCAGASVVFWQHLVNVALHALVCVLVVRTCRHAGGGDVAALIAGLIFALLPIHTEAVAPVVGRADLLAAVGTLAAVLCHGRANALGASGYVWRWRIATAVAAFLAMGAKESGVSVVPLVILFDVFDPCRARGTSPIRAWLSIRTVRRLAYLMVPIAAYLALRYCALGAQLHQAPPLSRTLNQLAGAAPWQHALGVVQAWGMYWATTLFPDMLCISYGINAVRLATGLGDPHVMLGLAVAAALVVASLNSRRRGHHAVTLLCLAILVAYAPTSNVFVLIRVFVAERIWYLPSVWIAILAGLGVAALPRRPIVPVIVGLVLLAMGARCWIRNSEWRNNGVLYAAAYRDRAESVTARHLYGRWLIFHGDREKGIAIVKSALEIDVGYTFAHRTLGMAYLESGDYAAALRYLSDADMQTPNHPPTVAAVAQARARVTERSRTGLERLREAASAAPDQLDAELALVRALRSVTLLDEALARFERSEPRFARRALWHYEYARTLILRARREDAMARMRKALELDAALVQVAVELAMLLLEAGDAAEVEEAARWAAHAAALAPESPYVLVAQAEVSGARGDTAAAVALYQRALAALPADHPNRVIWAQRARTLGG